MSPTIMRIHSFANFDEFQVKMVTESRTNLDEMQGSLAYKKCFMFCRFCTICNTVHCNICIECNLFSLKNAEPLRRTVALQFGGRKPPRRSDKVQAKPKTVDKGKQVKSKFQYTSIHFPVYY